MNTGMLRAAGRANGLTDVHAAVFFNLFSRCIFKGEF